MSTCGVCFEEYDREQHIPQLLNPCGHCLCLRCKQQLPLPVVISPSRVRRPPCPWCRTEIESFVENRALLTMIEEVQERPIESEETENPPPRFPLSEPLARRQIQMFLEAQCCRFPATPSADFPMYTVEVQKKFVDLVDQLWTEHCCFDIPELGAEEHPGESALRALREDSFGDEVMRRVVRQDPALRYLETLFGMLDYSQRDQIEAFLELLRGARATLTLQEYRVHILWDTENVRLADTPDFLGALEQLFCFLESRHIGVRRRFRVSAFFIAGKHQAPSKRMLKTMRDLGFELHDCPEGKKEEVDRQIERRLNTIADDYDPMKTRVVVISSDKDFIEPMRMLRGKGFLAYVLHNASAGSPHERALGVNPSGAFSIREALGPSLVHLLSVCPRCPGHVANERCNLCVSCQNCKRLVPPTAIVALSQTCETCCSTLKECQHCRSRFFPSLLVGSLCRGCKCQNPSCDQVAVSGGFCRAHVPAVPAVTRHPAPAEARPQEVDLPPGRHQSLHHLPATSSVCRGRIIRWGNRGFGFAEFSGLSAQVFVHISNFDDPEPDSSLLYGQPAIEAAMVPGWVRQTSKGVEIRRGCKCLSVTTALRTFSRR
eukprot:RCo052757